MLCRFALSGRRLASRSARWRLPMKRRLRTPKPRRSSSRESAESRLFWCGEGEGDATRGGRGCHVEGASGGERGRRRGCGRGHRSERGSGRRRRRGRGREGGDPRGRRRRRGGERGDGRRRGRRRGKGRRERGRRFRWRRGHGGKCARRTRGPCGGRTRHDVDRRRVLR